MGADTIASGQKPFPTYQGMGGMKARGAPSVFPRPLMFEEIPNAAEVFELVWRVQEQAQSSG